MITVELDEELRKTIFHFKRKNYGKKIEFKDHEGKKVMEGKLQMGIRSMFRVMRSKDMIMFSFKDSNKKAIGEVCFTKNIFKINNTSGEIIATVSGLNRMGLDPRDHDLVIKTPIDEFKIDFVVNEYETKNWRRKTSLKKYLSRIDISTKNDSEPYFSIKPSLINYRKKEMFEIDQFKDPLELDLFFVCTISLLLAHRFWPPQRPPSQDW